MQQPTWRQVRVRSGLTSLTTQHNIIDENLKKAAVMCLSPDRCGLDRTIIKRVNPHPYAPAQFPPRCSRNRNRRLFRSAIVSFSLFKSEVRIEMNASLQLKIKCAYKYCSMNEKIRATINHLGEARLVPRRKSLQYVAR